MRVRRSIVASTKRPAQPWRNRAAGAGRYTEGMRDPALPTFPITVTRDGVLPLPEQIATQVGAAVERGLVAGRLPSTRTLAEFLGVSRGVTAAAYDLLGARGYLDSRPGSGAYARRAAVRRVRAEAGGPEPIDLRPVASCPELFPVAEWRAAWRDATFRPPPVDAPPALGLVELREAVAEYVLAALGVGLTDRAVLITAGAAQGLRVVLEVLGLSAGQVAVAEPAPAAVVAGVGGSAAAFRVGAVPRPGADSRPYALPQPGAGSGTRVVPRLATVSGLAVDDEGARVDAVPPGCRAIVVGADARAPLGRLMTGRRRAEVARWARRTGGVVVDVAADAGLSGSARRLPRLLDVAGDAGILLGGFGDQWGVALGLGFAILPRHLAEAAARRPGPPGERPSYLAQRAMATLLRGGAVDRLARRLDRLAAQRGRLVEAALAGLPGIRVDGVPPTGVAAVHLPRHLDAAAVAGGLLAHGVRLETSAGRYFSRRPVPPALLVGYLGPSDADFPRALATLRAGLGVLG